MPHGFPDTCLRVLRSSDDGLVAIHDTVTRVPAWRLLLKNRSRHALAKASHRVERGDGRWKEHREQDHQENRYGNEHGLLTFLRNADRH